MKFASMSISFLVAHLLIACTILAGQLSSGKRRSNVAKIFELLSAAAADATAADAAVDVPSAADVAAAAAAIGLEYKDQKRTEGQVTGVELNLIERSLFSDSELECCPTAMELSHRLVGINWEGIVLELFHLPNFTQTFYETICLPEVKDRPCQFIDPRYRHHSSCVQQYQYVYAFGRPYGHWREQYRVDYIRIATGCKCRLQFKQTPARDEYAL